MNARLRAGEGHRLDERPAPWAPLSHRRALLIASLVLLLVGLRASGGERPPDCLGTERGVAQAELAYRARGDRCEGLFVAPVSGSIGMVLVGFYDEPPAFDLDRDPEVLVRVDPAPGRSLSLRVRSLVWRVYYQMDTSAFDPQGVYRWSTQMIRQPQLRLGPEQVAAVACTERCHDSARTQFFPVRIGAASTGRPRNATIVLQSSVELSQIRLSVFHGGRKIVTDQVVGGSSFPTDRPIRLPIGRWLRSGVNEVTLVGIERHSREAIAGFHAQLVVPAT